MRDVAKRLEAETVNEDGMTFRRLHSIALGGLDTDAGRTLLAELEALRALDRMLRGTWTAEERVAALAAVDAAREGE